MKTISKIMVLLGLSLALFESSSAFALPFIGKGKGEKQVDAQYGRGHYTTKGITGDLIELALIAEFRDLITAANENQGTRYDPTLDLLRSYFGAHNTLDEDLGNQYGAHYYPYFRDLPNNRNLETFRQEAHALRQPYMFPGLNTGNILNLLRNYFRTDSYDTIVPDENVDYYMQAAIRSILDFVVYRNSLDGAPEIDAGTQDDLVVLLRQAANNIFGQLDLTHHTPRAFIMENPVEYFGENPGQVTYPRAGRFFGTTPSDTNLDAFNAAVQVLFLAEYAQIFGAFTPSTYGDMFTQVRDNLLNLEQTTERANLLAFILIGGNREYQRNHPIVDRIAYWAETGLNYTGVDVEPTEYLVDQNTHYVGDDEEARIFINDEEIAGIAQAIANTFDRQFIEDHIFNALDHVPGFNHLTETEQAEAVVALNRALHRFTPNNPGFEYVEDEHNVVVEDHGNPIAGVFGDQDIEGVFGNLGDEDAESSDEEPQSDSESKKEEEEVLSDEEGSDNENDKSDEEEVKNDSDSEFKQEEKEEKEKSSPKRVRRKAPSLNSDVPVGERRSAPNSPQTERRSKSSLKRQGSAPSLFKYEDQVKAEEESKKEEEEVLSDEEGSDNEADKSSEEEVKNDSDSEFKQEEKEKSSPKRVRRKAPSLNSDVPVGGRRSAPTSPQTERRNKPSLNRQGSAPSLFKYEDQVKAEEEFKKEEEEVLSDEGKPIIVKNSDDEEELLEDEEKDTGYKAESEEEDSDKSNGRLSNEDLEEWQEQLLANDIKGLEDLDGNDLFTAIQQQTDESFHRPASPDANAREVQRINRLAMVTITRAAFVELMGFVNDGNANGDDVQLYIQLIQQIQKDIAQYANNDDVTASMAPADLRFAALVEGAIQPIVEAALNGTLDENQSGDDRLEGAIEKIDAFIAQAYGTNPGTLRSIIGHFTQTVIREYQAALKASEYTIERLQRLRMRLRIAINANNDYYTYRSEAGNLSHSTAESILGITNLEESLLRVDNTVAQLTHALNAVELTLGTLDTFEEELEEMEDLSDEEEQAAIFNRIVGSVHEAREEARDEVQEARMRSLSSEINQKGGNIRAKVLQKAKEKVLPPLAPPPPSDKWLQANTAKKSTSTLSIKGKKVRTRNMGGEENLTLQEMAAKARLQMGRLAEKLKQVEADREQLKKELEEQAIEEAEKEAKETGIRRTEGGLMLNAKILQAMSSENLSEDTLRKMNPAMFGDTYDDGFFATDAEWGDTEDDADKDVETKDEDPEEDTSEPTLKKEDSGSNLVQSISESVIAAGGLESNKEEPFSLDALLGAVGGNDTIIEATNDSELIYNELMAIEDDAGFQTLAESIKVEGVKALLERSLRQRGILGHLEKLIQSFTVAQLVAFQEHLPYNLWHQMRGYLSPQQLIDFNKTRLGVNQSKELESRRNMRSGFDSDPEEWDDDDAGSLYSNDDDSDSQTVEAAYRNPRPYREDDEFTAMQRGQTLGFGYDWERRLREDSMMPEWMHTNIDVETADDSFNADDDDAVTHELDITEIARGDTLGYGDQETGTDSWEELANGYLANVQTAATRAALTAAFMGLNHQLNSHK